jgi:integrase
MAVSAAARGTRERYLQWFEPTRTYRFRRAVPIHLRATIGLSEWTDTLSPNHDEAKRQLSPHVERTDRILALAEAGNWPEINDVEIEAVAEGWWRLFQIERSRLLTNPQGLPSWPNGRERLDDINPESWALASDDDLSRSVRKFISGPRHWPHPQAPDKNRDRVEALLGDPKRSAQLSQNKEAMGRLLRHCRILHHHAASGYLGQGVDRAHAIMRILDMIEGLEVDPRQIVDAIEARTAVTAQTPCVTPAPTAPTIFPPLRLGHIATEDGSDLISMWAKETGIRPRGIYQVRLDMAKFVSLIEHDDATRVTPHQIVRFKEHLAGKGLGAPTINRYLSAVKSPLTWAEANLKIATNPGAGIKYDSRGGTKKKGRRLGYTDDQARVILSAARGETKPYCRWIPWLCAFTGCRLDEIAGRDARDIKRVGSTWVLDIPEGKNEGAARKIPLHSKLITEGFINYWRQLPPDGPLFPDLTDGRYGRAGTATKSIGRWLRQVQKQTGVLLVEKPRYAPNHSWRHRFKSEARRVGKDQRPIMSEETSDALTGHYEGKVSRDYGEYYVDSVLRPAIESMLSPFDIKSIEAVTEMAKQPERGREASV